MGSISIQTKIKADTQKVFQSITEQHHVQRWFAPQVIMAPVKGSFAAFAFEFDISFKIEIIELEKKSVKWKVVEGIEGWEGSMISFEIIPEGNYSLLNFNHSAIAENSKQDRWESSWKEFIVKLAEYAAKL